MVQATTGALTTAYRHNGLGQRVSKTAPGSPTVSRRFVYDESGHLIGEYDGSGAPIQETVYLVDLPIAVLSGTNTIHYVHADQINTPRAITDTQGTVRWKWESDPFGVGTPDQDPDGDTVPLTYNLRYPGQYFDAETGLSYNYFRDYDPSLGRYIQSDPIGLDGGINTYGYVGNNPLLFLDPFGLTQCDVDVALQVAEDNLSGRRVPAPGIGGWRVPGFTRIVPPSEISRLGTHGVTGKSPSAVSRSFDDRWIDTLLNPRYGECLNDQQAEMLLLTIIHEGAHWSSPPQAPYNQDSNSVSGFAYDAEKEFGTKALLAEYIRARQKCACGCK